jgi:hypothetical protein
VPAASSAAEELGGALVMMAHLVQSQLVTAVLRRNAARVADPLGA